MLFEIHHWGSSISLFIRMTQNPCCCCLQFSGCLCCYFPSHKGAHKEKELPKGRLRINNKQLPSTINQVSVLVTTSTPVSEIIANALIKFDLEVRNP